MIKPPALSIITITKNNCAGLGKTYASLLGQSVPFKTNYEWIIIDGKSDDGTSLFLSKDGLNAIQQDGDGIYDAMNAGLAKAAGDYIVFLNAGDLFADPDTLSLILRHIESIPSDFIYGDMMEEVGGTLYVKKARAADRIARGMFTSHQAMIYKREISKDMQFDTSYKIAGDYDFTVRFLKCCKNISYIPAPLCFFESGGTSQVNATLGRHEEFRSKISNDMCGVLQAVMIYALQYCSLFVRTYFPDFYRLLKRL